MLVENVLARHWSSPIATTPHSRSRDDRRLACRKDPLRGSDTAATGRRRGSSRRVLSRLHATQNGYEDPYAPLEPERFALDSTSDERALVIETGAIGRQANGAVLARQGDTVIYTTACCKPEASLLDFVPLTVDYVEKLSSVGRTAQGFIKRERQRDHEVLTSRIVDRSIRPLFPEGWSKETQILETVMSYDNINSTQPLAITAAGVCLAVSDLPFEKPVVGVRVGWIDDDVVVNPTAEEQENSRLDLVMAGTTDGIVMIETSADFIKEEDFLKALESGLKYVKRVSEKLERWIAEVGKEKMTDGIRPIPSDLTTAVYDFCHDDVVEIFSKPSKKERNSDRALLWEKIEKRFLTEAEQPELDMAADKFSTKGIRVMVGVRIQDPTGADAGERGEIGWSYSREHSTDLFFGEHLAQNAWQCAVYSRKYTGVVCGDTGCDISLFCHIKERCMHQLGSQKAGQKIDTLQEEELQRFYLQYFFPPASVGEVRRFTLYPGRRELGHGQLATWALSAAVPDVEHFPYTIRVESTITESDGSSSMASVCGACLAMLDAGVPLAEPIAGIAMGLMIDADNESFTVLSDIMGTEDALGDMDFKVAGSADAITALQMDVKVPGVTYKILSAALTQAKSGRKHILKEMDKCRPRARCEISPLAPHIKLTSIDSANVGKLIGPGGKTVRALEEESKTTLLIDASGEIEINGSSFEDVERASELIQLTVGKLTVGQVIKNAVVVSIKSFGAFVSIAPGREGLVHLSEISAERVKDVKTVVKIGDRFDVKVLSCNAQNKYSFSRRALLPQPPTATATPPDLKTESETKPEETESATPADVGATATSETKSEEVASATPADVGATATSETKSEEAAAATPADVEVTSEDEPEETESTTALDVDASSETKPEEAESTTTSKV